MTRPRLETDRPPPRSSRGSRASETAAADPEESAFVALVLTLAATTDLQILAGALEGLQLDGALERAVDDGTVIVTDGVPVVADAPDLTGVAPSARRRVHRALADAIDPAGPLARRRLRADHLVAATLLPDESVARELAALAAELRLDDAIAEAAERWKQAAVLTPELDDRARLLREAGEALWLLSRSEEAGVTLLEAFAATDDPSQRAAIAIVLGQIELWTRGPRHALAILLPTADAASTVDPDRAAALLVHASNATLLSLDAESGLRFARRAVELADAGSGAAAPAAQVALAVAHALHGDDAEATTLLGPLDELAWSMLDADTDAIPELEHLLNVLGLLATMTERWDRGEAYLERVVFRARSAGSNGMLAGSVALLAELRFRSGRIAEAARLLRGDVDGDRPWGPGVGPDAIPDAVMRLWLRSVVARNDAVTGDVSADDVRANAEALAGEAQHMGVTMALVFARHALALVALAEGDHARAAAELDHIAAALAAGDIHEPGISWWQVDHVEALWRAGRRHEAAAAVERLRADAAATGRPSARAALARCRALMAVTRDEMEAATTEAMDQWLALPSPFEAARTLMLRAERCLELGDADASVEAAVEAAALFLRLGVAPWVARAKAVEARARDASDPFAALTDAERRVADAVVAGARNRAVAEQLYLSERTVEAHLERIYRKLGVSNRTQLAALKTSWVRYLPSEGM